MTVKRIEANAETLVGIDAFRRLGQEQRQQLASDCRAHQYSAGQEILSYYDDSRDVHFIVSGQVQATIFSMSGRQVILQDLDSGAMFGELSAIDGEPRSAHVLALNDALICSLSPQAFLQAVYRYPSVAEVTLKRLTSMVRRLSGKVFEISALPVKQRIHAELLRLAVQGLDHDQPGIAVIAPAPTHGEIANHIGTHREGVTRELNRLKKEGLIDRDGPKLVVKDVARLREMVQEVMGVGMEN